MHGRHTGQTVVRRCRSREQKRPYRPRAIISCTDARTLVGSALGTGRTGSAKACQSPISSTARHCWLWRGGSAWTVTMTARAGARALVQRPVPGIQALVRMQAPSRFDLGGAPDLARRDVLPPRSVSQPQRQRIPRRCGAGNDGGSASWIPGLVLRIRWGAFSGRSGRLRCAARLPCHATLCPVHARRKARVLVARLRGLRNNRRRSHRSFGRRCRLRPMRGRAGSGGRSGTRSAVNACRFHRTSVPLRFRHTRYIRPAFTLGYTVGYGTGQVRSGILLGQSLGP